MRLSSEQSEGYLRSTHPIYPPDIPLQAIYPTPREELASAEPALVPSAGQAQYRTIS